MSTPSSKAGHAGLRQKDLTELRLAVAGCVLTPEDEGYRTECATFNQACTLTPAIVVGAADSRDVRTAVLFAGRHGLPVAVKGTAHQMVASASGGVLITTARMRGIHIDPVAGTATVEAGVVWREVLLCAAAHGLAPIAGSAPEVGVVGYTLGGGQSPLLGRSSGYAADHVRRMEVVTADGEVHMVTPGDEPDLFWALLGAKGNFGVVTKIEFALFPVTRFYGGGIYYPGEYLEDILEAWRSWLPTLDERTTSSIAVQRLPDLPVLPPPLRGAFVVHLRFGHLGPAAEGERLLAPLRAVAPVLVDLVGEEPFTAIGNIHLDPVDPVPYVDRSLCLREFTQETVQALVGLAGAGSGCSLTSLEIRALGGAFDREPVAPNSVPTRGVPFVVFGFGVGGVDRLDGLRGELTRVVDGLAPWTAQRHMVNFLSPDEATDDEGVRAVYGAERYERLAAVKKRYDPGNMFRFNHNIAPA